MHVWSSYEFYGFMQNLFAQPNQITMNLLYAAVILATSIKLVFSIISLINAKKPKKCWGYNSSFRKIQRDEYELTFALLLKLRKAEGAGSKHFLSEPLSTWQLTLSEIFLALLPTVVYWVKVETLSGTYCFNI